MRVYNCSPPYITDKKNLWCKEKFKNSKEAQELNWNFCNKRMDQGKCYPPCEFTE